MPTSEYDWQIEANSLVEGSTRDGFSLVVSAGRVVREHNGRCYTQLEKQRVPWLRLPDRGD